MRRYESIAIVDPDLSEEKLGTLNDRMTELIAQMDGFLVLFDDWGIRNMAYEVKKKTRGHYIRLDYCGLGALVNELERFFRIDDRVMKYMTIMTDEKADVERIKAELEAARAAEEAPAAEPAAAEEAAAEGETEASPAETPAEAPAEAPVEAPAEEAPAAVSPAEAEEAPESPAETAVAEEEAKPESATISPDQTEKEGKE